MISRLSLKVMIGREELIAEKKKKVLNLNNGMIGMIGRDGKVFLKNILHEYLLYFAFVFVENGTATSINIHITGAFGPFGDNMLKSKFVTDGRTDRKINVFGKR